jgi:hypothetical protein
MKRLVLGLCLATMMIFAAGRADASDWLRIKLGRAPQSSNAAKSRVEGNIAPNEHESRFATKYGRLTPSGQEVASEESASRAYREDPGASEPARDPARERFLIKYGRAPQK